MNLNDLQCEIFCTCQCTLSCVHLIIPHLQEIVKLQLSMHLPAMTVGTNTFISRLLLRNISRGLGTKYLILYFVRY